MFSLSLTKEANGLKKMKTPDLQFYCKQILKEPPAQIKKSHSEPLIFRVV